MARHAPTLDTRIRRRRLVAVILLSLGASLWLGSSMMFLVGPGTAGQFFMPIFLPPMALSLLAIFLLTRARSAGVWLGLGLQGVLVLFGLAITFAMSQPLGLVPMVLGVATALALAAFADEPLRP
jgi:peptidoglycan/LPS O-acetylase OafA/YrhL